MILSENFVVYQSTDRFGSEYKATTPYRWFSRKGRKFLESSIGGNVWMITGTRDSTKRMIYQLVGRFTPSEILEEETDPGTRIIHGELGISLEEPLTLNGVGWFEDLLEEQNNFSLGFNRIRSNQIIAELQALLELNSNSAASRVPLITIFHDSLQSNAHQLFQEWRTANPSGFFINCKGPNNSLLHNASCSHLGDTVWGAQNGSTLGDKRKVCARKIAELRVWAVEHHLEFSECKHCKRHGLDDTARDILSVKDYANSLETILSSALLVAVHEEFESIIPGRVLTTVSRVIRDTALARRVKELHDFRCQICGHTLELADGSFYAEAHHIRPLGSPHDGPDRLDNLVCVCPNHHVELDYRLKKLLLSDLGTVEEHKLSAIHVDYHNNLMERSNSS